MQLWNWTDLLNKGLMEPTLWEFFRDRLPTSQRRWVTCRKTSVCKRDLCRWVCARLRLAVSSDAASGIRDPLAVLYRSMSFDVVIYIRLWRLLLKNFPDEQPSFIFKWASVSSFTLLGSWHYSLKNYEITERRNFKKQNYCRIALQYWAAIGNRKQKCGAGHPSTELGNGKVPCRNI